MRLGMSPLDTDESFRDVVGAEMRRVVGDVAHLRSLGDGLSRTRDILHRAIAAYEQSRQLLMQIELAERKQRRNQELQNGGRAGRRNRA